MFIDAIFKGKKRINFETYQEINTQTSSEMLFTVMQQLHENLPCSQNFFKLKKKYENKKRKMPGKIDTTPVETATLASPKIIRHLSIHSNSSNGSGSN